MGGLALVAAPLCGGQDGSFTSREAAALSGVRMPADPGTRKGPSEGIFQIHLQTVTPFYFVMPCSTLGAFGSQVCFHPTGGTFLWELDWKGEEERFPPSLYVRLPAHPAKQCSQEQTGLAPELERNPTLCRETHELWAR